ncbi:uncharacterized protein EV420DRAFT_1532945 [Desarmillaria tabescens]|uniref:DUF6534 domain-containing protein n=1 Tax=Armillaria tabescens TaxID=1929756 RepID=A0AA39N7P8_ARMTA|nr:uncharacterized protein EV420DRAFT_1532945 [Desarmillaria tabescens]KAK0460562.1 hypothetical protein EV420DRAFT_1532945 [Desarmillaria tabescens]
MANTTTSNCPVPTENPIILDLTSSYGSLLVGSWLACAMWGVSSLQVFIYYMNSANVDPRFLKFLIGALWMFDTTNELLILKAQWRGLIHQYGRIEGLGETPVELLHHIWVETIVIVIVQLYFIRRIYIFSKQTFCSKKQKRTTVAFMVIMVMLSSWQLVVVFVYLINVYGKPLEVVFSPLIVGLNFSYLSVSVAVDVVVSFSMIFLLTRMGTPIVPKKMRMIYRLIMVIVLSGSFTAVIATVALILIKIYPTSLHYCIVDFSLCSLYFSTLLANLNARAYIQSPEGINTISAFSAAHRGRDSDALALGSLTHPHNGVSGIAATTAGGSQIQRERDIKTDDLEVFPPLKDQCAMNNA